MARGDLAALDRLDLRRRNIDHDVAAGRVWRRLCSRFRLA